MSEQASLRGALCDGCHYPMDMCECAEIREREEAEGSCSCPYCSAGFDDGLPVVCPFCHHQIR